VAAGGDAVLDDQPEGVASLDVAYDHDAGIVALRRCKPERGSEIDRRGGEDF